MESANFHLQQEDHQVVDYSFPWSQNLILNATNNNINLKNLYAHTNYMVQDLGFPYNGIGYPIENVVTHELQHLASMKDEFSFAESYPKFLELLNCNTKNTNNQDHLLTNFSNGCQIKGGQLHLNNQNCYNGSYSQIFPTMNISSLNQSTTSSASSSPSTISSSSFDINCLPALDIHGSPRFDTSFSHNHLSLNANNIGGVSYGFDSIIQPNYKKSVYSNKISPVSSSTKSTDQSGKRSASKYIDTKADRPVAPKKSRSEPRSSSAPFQVRKERLGDRVAAIQQLVAPFGKTDTASVLMEAIGYIKFLQTQIETLSVPYMKPRRKFYGISSEEGIGEDGNTRAKRDLQSRGLCLVPLSYITDGCGSIWLEP